MKIKVYIIILSVLLVLLSCKKYVKKETTNYKYYDVTNSDTISQPILIAVTNEEHLQYGVDIAYIGKSGDTIIPFGKYAYYGTDTLKHFACVIEHPNDSTWGRPIGIDRNKNILFELVIFDNGPDYFKEELTRVLRNQKMGYANRFGQVVIPCKFDYANWFEDGKASVSFDAREYVDLDEHTRIESDEWFLIDKKGNKIN